MGAAGSEFSHAFCLVLSSGKGSVRYVNHSHVGKRAKPKQIAVLWNAGFQVTLKTAWLYDSSFISGPSQLL